MNFNVLPCFKTHYSFKSILTAAEPAVIKKDSPVSVFDIAKTHELDSVIVIEDSITGFLELYQSSKKANIKLIYGLRLNCVNDLSVKNEEMLKTGCKIIILIKNTQGYYDLIKVSSFYQQEGFYYHGNIDYTNLKRLWTNNLMLVIPFYDSFIFMNSLYGHLCVPNFSFAKPTFLIENSNLPFDYLIQQKVISYTKNNNLDLLPARSIYYMRYSDFQAFLTYRCIRERSTLQDPNLDDMSSDWFCFEKWQEQNKNPETVYLK